MSASSTRPGGSAVAERRHLGLVAASAAGLLVADQLTKAWAVHRLSDGGQIHVVGSLRLRLAFNPGTAFSMWSGSNVGPFVAVLALVVVGFLIVSGGTTRTKVGAVAVGLVAGGALGNLLDRAFREGSGFLGGHVIDFIDAQWWPVFNVADVGVVVGAIVLVIASAFAPERGEAADADDTGEVAADDGTAGDAATTGGGAGDAPAAGPETAAAVGEVTGDGGAGGDGDAGAGGSGARGAASTDEG